MEGKYFKGGRRSELQELREELQMSSKDRRKDAIKKIIGAMTTGKDVSSLFPDVVNCIQTDNIELKKLVYLYVINYAKVQPELAILAVNTFCKDARDKNPLIRALAIRTMGYIRLAAITEHLIEPLKRCQTDADAYVRKTAAMCIGKLYGISPSLVETEGFIQQLQDMLMSDDNSTVVANAAATLVEISEQSDDHIFERMINRGTGCLESLLKALNTATEWGQVYILDSLTCHHPSSASEARKVVDAILPRFSHINPAVVMSAMKVVIRLTPFLDKETARHVQLKLAAPLVTLASLEPEIQYVALRCILLVIARWPKLLEDHVASFYCKYRDPFYVKVEKLDIMVRLASANNYTKILGEFREYANDVDIDFVRKNVRALGKLAIRLECALDASVKLLEEWLHFKLVHLTEECTLVLMDLLRCYPRVFSLDLFSACADANYLFTPESKAAIIWIVGQYASKIPDAAEYLLNMAESFDSEDFSVQTSLITATVKVELACPGNNVLDILRINGVNSPNPDISDKSKMYLRLLERGAHVAQKIVSIPLPKINEAAHEKHVLDNMLAHLGQVSTIYHLPSWAIESSAGSSRAVDTFASRDYFSAAKSSSGDFSARGKAKAAKSQRNLIDDDYEEEDDDDDDEDEDGADVDADGADVDADGADVDVDVDEDDDYYYDEYNPRDGGRFGASSGRGAGSGTGRRSQYSKRETFDESFDDDEEEEEEKKGGFDEGEDLDDDANYTFDDASANGNYYSGAGSEDLLEFGDSTSASRGATRPSGRRRVGVFKYSCKPEVVLSENSKGSQGKSGISVKAHLFRRNAKVYLRLNLYNATASSVTLQAIQLNVNSFGLGPVGAINPVTIASQGNGKCLIPLEPNVIPSNKPPESKLVLQVAIKTCLDIFYFGVGFQLPIVFQHEAQIDATTFVTYWHSYTARASVDIKSVDANPHGYLSRRLQKLGMQTVGLVALEQGASQSLCFYACTTNSLALLAATFNNQLLVKSAAAALLPLAVAAINNIL